MSKIKGWYSEAMWYPGPWILLGTLLMSVGVIGVGLVTLMMEPTGNWLSYSFLASVVVGFLLMGWGIGEQSRKDFERTFGKEL